MWVRNRGSDYENVPNKLFSDHQNLFKHWPRYRVVRFKSERNTPFALGFANLQFTRGRER